MVWRSMEKRLADLGSLCLSHLSLNSDIIGLDSIIHDNLVKHYKRIHGVAVGSIHAYRCDPMRSYTGNPCVCK